MKFNLFIAFAALAFGSSLVLAVPVDITAREADEVGDFITRDFADLVEFQAREEGRHGHHHKHMDEDDEDLRRREIVDEWEELLAREGGGGRRRGHGKGKRRRPDPESPPPPPPPPADAGASLPDIPPPSQ